MPTSGEARIHTTSSYNLRSNPLPKSKQTANKENVSRLGSVNSRIPQRKSKLPVKTSNSGRPPISKAASDAKRSQTKVRSVPNFEKLHKNWQKKFQQGKAVVKKPCTQTHEFDLTRSGTKFKRAYYSGDEDTEEDEFQADQDALESILDNRGLGHEVTTGRLTVATMGDMRQTSSRAIEHRQTLGALPSRYNSGYNKRNGSPSAPKTSRLATGRLTTGSTSKPRQSVVHAEQQEILGDGFEFETDDDELTTTDEGDDFEFEADDAALATILNDVGIQPGRGGTTTRQTIASTQARTFQRTSIYYQEPKVRNKNKVYDGFARLTIGGALSPTVIRMKEVTMAQTLPKKLAGPQSSSMNQLQKSAILNHAAATGKLTPRWGPKTPGTASRVLNPAYQNSPNLGSSPALRVNRQPRSAIKMANAQTKERRALRWAEVLESPSDKAQAVISRDQLATGTLFVDEDAQYPTAYSVAQKQQEEIKKIEDGTSANRHKMEEMEAVELQLQMEIERLQREATGTSLRTNMPAESAPSFQSPAPTRNPTHNTNFMPSQNIGQAPENVLLPATPILHNPGNSRYISSQQLYQQQPPGNMPLYEKSVPTLNPSFPISSQQLYREQPPTEMSSYKQSVPTFNPNIQSVLSSNQQYRERPPENTPSYDKSALSLNPSYPSSLSSQQQHLEQYAPLVTSQTQRAVQDLRFGQNVVSSDFKQTQLSEAGYMQHTAYQSIQSHTGIDNMQVKSDTYRSTQLASNSQYGSAMSVVQQTQNVYHPQTSGIQRQNGMPLSLPQQRSVADTIISDSSRYGSLQDHLKSEQTFPGPVSNPISSSMIASVIEQPVNHGANVHTSSHSGIVNPNTANTVLKDASTYQRGQKGLGSFQGVLPSSSISSAMGLGSFQGVQNSSLVSTTASATLNNVTLPGGLSTVYGLPTSVTHVTHKQMGKTVNALTSMPLSSAFEGSKLSLIQTPLPVKPGNQFKHQVLKKYTPAVQPKHSIIDVPLPIQTPMAMRNAMSGVRGHHIVSPIAQLASPVAQIATPASLQYTNDSVQSMALACQSDTSLATTEPKLRLDFESVEDSESLELVPCATNSVPGFTAITSAPNLAVKGQGGKSYNQPAVELLTPAMRLKGQWNKNVAGQLFHETLLDEECALYTCRLQSKFAPKSPVDRNCNPIAKVLMEGDDMHFVPITEELPIHTISPAGSAFNGFASWT